jgi:hypothetical protein
LGFVERIKKIFPKNVVGCGPVPMTLILMSRLYGIQSIGLDICAESVRLSKKVARWLRLEKIIDIFQEDHFRLRDLDWNVVPVIQGDHFRLPVQETYALITVAANTRPKDEIFAHLAKAFSKDTKLSYRIYEKGLKRLMDDQPVSEFPPEFKEYSRIRPDPPVNNTSVFLVKNER